MLRRVSAERAAQPGTSVGEAALEPAIERPHLTARPLLQPRYVLAACLALFIATRLIGLDTTLTADEGYWVQRSLRFGAALARGDLNSTYRTGHPGVTVMWVGLLGIGPRRLEPFLPAIYVDVPSVERAPAYLEVLAAARRAIVVATAALAVLIVGLSWKLFGPGPALLGGLLLLLDPYLAGMTRLLHPDALLAPLVTVSLLAGLIFWFQRGGWRYLVLSGVAAGLALLTKTPAVALVAFFSLYGLAACWTRRGSRRWPLAILAWGMLAGLAVLVLWPALWVNPIGRLGDLVAFVRAVGANPHYWSNFFLGRRISGDPGLLFYPIALAVRLSPVVLAGLLPLALLLQRRRRVAPALLGLIEFVLLFIVIMSLGAKKLDRYALPAIMVLDLLAGIGFWRLTQLLSAGRPRTIPLLLALSCQSVLFWQAYPGFLATYNPLLGGINGARQLVLVGWGEGLDQAASYLNGLPDAEHLVVTTHYHDVLRPLFRGTTLRMSGATGLDYCVVYINMLQRNLIPSAVREVMATKPPEFTAVVHGVPYAWVYRLPAGSTVGPGEDQESDEDHD